MLEELDEELPVPPEDELVEVEVTLPETRVSCEAERTRLIPASPQGKSLRSIRVRLRLITSTFLEVVSVPVWDGKFLSSPSS